MSDKNRKNVCVKFAHPIYAECAMFFAKEKFPLHIPQSKDLSRVSDSTVIFQVNSTPAPSTAIEHFLLHCPGAMPKD